MENKTWRIVKVIDEYNVVINGGTSDNLKVDDLLEIIGSGEKVIDPDTQEVLGTLDSIKALIKVTKAYEYMAECKSAIVTRIPGIFELNYGPISNPVADSFGPTYKTERLNVDPADISGRGTSNEPIRIGDLVKLRTRTTSEKQV